MAWIRDFLMGWSHGQNMDRFDNLEKKLDELTDRVDKSQASSTQQTQTDCSPLPPPSLIDQLSRQEWQLVAGDDLDYYFNKYTLQIRDARTGTIFQNFEAFQKATGRGDSSRGPVAKARLAKLTPEQRTRRNTLFRQLDEVLKRKDHQAKLARIRLWDEIKTFDEAHGTEGCAPD